MGCPSPAGTCDVFDFANPKARALFIEECVNATQSGYVDGCFLDRAVDGTPTDSGDDRAPCAGADCRYKLNLTAAQSKAYAAGHVKVRTAYRVGWHKDVLCVRLPSGESLSNAFHRGS